MSREGLPVPDNNRIHDLECGPGEPGSGRCAKGHWIMSGNPGGQATAPYRLAKEFAQAHTIEALEKLVQIMRDEKNEPRVQMEAARHILDRSLGKPKESVEVTTPDVANAIREASEQAKLEIGH